MPESRHDVCLTRFPFGAAPLWAKIQRDSHGAVRRWHSLPDHSADVAAVVGALLDLPTINRRLARAAGLADLDATQCARLSALAFLHDIGKANRGFRARADARAQIVGHIDQTHWLLRGSNSEDLCNHLFRVLPLEEISAWFESEDIWDAVFAHHGRPWKDVPSRPHWRPEKDDDPIADLAQLRPPLERWFAPAFANAPKLPASHAFDHAFAGLLMLADWLGSDTQFFRFADGEEPERMPFARAQARKALQAVGLAVEDRRAGVAERRPDFSTLFGVAEPYPIQAHAVTPWAPCVVLEAETGSGKTEAALWRFVHLFREGAVDGLYFALPTRVAATQMFGRIKKPGARRSRAPPPPRAAPGVTGAAIPDRPGAVRGCGRGAHPRSAGRHRRGD